MKKIILNSLYYSPGYSDMSGGYHSVSLKQNGEDEWEYHVSDRTEHSSPTIVKVYSVTPEAVGDLEQFLIKNRIFSLEKRPKSDLFATDYSPWLISIDYEKSFLGKMLSKECCLKEYRVYTRKDMELIKELLTRLAAIHGELISESAEE